ncbi:ribonuclease [Sphingobium phenoxybenzoativorans]|uniref:ribonuclease n=1 Tax=Sphingobium phenoxybenzoativorans TaxID=1592790 RepID=UPI000872B458|nr:ribonuclease [Sphingobium phenoxybenzoativorans]
MAEWLYEEGIGESRAALIEKGRLVEALVEREGRHVLAGAVAQGRLVRTVIPRKRGIARLDSGEEVLIEPIPPKIAEGTVVLIDILRERIGEDGRDKLAKGRIAQPGAKARPGPSLLQRLRATGIPITPCPAHEEDRLEAHGWSETLEEAMTGDVGAEDAALRIFLTPAMILIDVDGSLPPAQLGPKGAKLAAQAIRRMGLAGSIGIDLPTMNNKDERAIAAAQIDKILPLPFERTAVNGFGFIQIIRKRERPNLMEIVREDKVLTAALALIRRGERHGNGGPVTLVSGPAVIDRLHKAPDWIAMLERRRGGHVGLRADAALAISAGYAE